MIGVPRRRADVLVDRLGDELLLYHPARETALYLNRTAYLIWQLCDGERSVAEIVELLERIFPDASVAGDVETGLHCLAECAAIDLISQR